LDIDYEGNYFEVTRFRRPLVEGWTDVIKADPQILLDRGYDKVIAVRRRSLREQIKAEAYYFRGAKTLNQVLDLYIKEPTFIRNVVKKHTRLEEQISKIDNPRFLSIYLEDWNNRTLIIYHKLLDFLEFPEEGRIQIVPIKRCKEEIKDCPVSCEYRRDFEAYSDSHESIDHIPCENIARIRENGN